MSTPPPPKRPVFAPKLFTAFAEGYRLADLRGDTLAGLTVAIVALPLAMALAVASGADPGIGLVTAIIAGFLISALGGSRFQIGGPTGAFIPVVYAIIVAHGYDGLVLATLMAGAMLVVAGLLRVGTLMKYLPQPLITGFTAGIAVIIFASQLKDLFGLTTPDLPAEFLPKMAGLWAARDTLDWAALALGLATIVGILAIRRFAPRFRARAVVVLVLSALSYFLLPSVATVTARFGELPHGLPWPALPPLSGEKMLELLPSAITIALLAGIESLLSAVVADRLIRGEHRPGAELLAQGAANLASPLFGGLPATGAIARTATNVDAGGRTPVAGIVHALLILAAMALLAPLAGALALPALAGLLVITAWNMAEPERWPHRLAMPRVDLALLFLTAVLTVLVDLTVAIAAGTLIGLIVKRWMRPPAASPDSRPEG